MAIISFQEEIQRQLDRQRNRDYYTYSLADRLNAQNAIYNQMTESVIEAMGRDSPNKKLLLLEDV